MGRSPTGLPLDQRSPWSKRPDPRGPEVIPATHGDGTPNPAFALAGWLDEGLTLDNAAALDDITWALASCEQLTPTQRSGLLDLVLGWALASQASLAVAS